MLLTWALITTIVFLTSCTVPAAPPATATPHAAVPLPLPTSTPLPAPAWPTATPWAFGDPLRYTTQSGDWLPALANRFAMTEADVLASNPALRMNADGLIDPGQALTMPANYLPLPGIAGPTNALLPDVEFVNAAAVPDWDTQAFLDDAGGFLSDHEEYADGRMRPAAEVIDRIAIQYALSPRLLLALIEHQSGLVTGGLADEDAQTYPLGYHDPLQTGLYRQLRWATDYLNRGYYGWRSGELLSVTLRDGRETRFDPWHNAGTVGVHTLFAQIMDSDAFAAATAPDGLPATWTRLYGGDPFAHDFAHFEPGLEQTEMALPFEIGRVWSFTGGPHTAWGQSLPWSAIDFAPPAAMTGCGYSGAWVTAVADGIVARSGENQLWLDLDGDGDLRTGWVLYHLHLSSDFEWLPGTELALGDPVGHPSCEGGFATGTHVHIARLYNGEWIPADGYLPFRLSGWQVHAADYAYDGTMTYDLPAMEIEACVCVADNTLTRTDGPDATGANATTDGVTAP